MRIFEVIKPIKSKAPMTPAQARINSLKQGVERSRQQLKSERERQRQQRDAEQMRKQRTHK
jgi:nicotinic acid mononucleotide adenylyltransferase